METGHAPDGCPPRCPGCPHRHLSAAQSTAQKTEWLKRKLAPWADRLLPIVSPDGPNRFGYREKTCLSAEWGSTGWQIGLTAGEELIPIFECPIHTERIRKSMGILAAALPPSSIFPPYAFPLKYVVQSGAQLVLVMKTRQLPDISPFIDPLWEKLSEIGIEGLWLHLFPSVGRRVFAKNGWHLVRGRPSSRDAAGFIYGPVAFQQVFPSLHDQALDRAETFFDPGPGDAVIDLYSGLGRTLARWFKRGALTAGVELCGEAVRFARKNVPGAEIFRGACAQRIVQLDSWRKGPASGKLLLIYVNPPRSGLEPEVVEWIIDAGPAKIAYLSCSAGTLRRDLIRLCAHGFEVREIRPYDFFPRTRHVETLATLQKH